MRSARVAPLGKEALSRDRPLIGRLLQRLAGPPATLQPLELNARDQDPHSATSGSALVELQRTLYASRHPTRHWLHQSRRERIESALRRLANERDIAAALEVGPGSGVYLPLLCELFEQVTASDVEKQFLDHLSGLVAERPNLELVLDDIAASELEAESFDLVLCSEVIEHTPEPERVLDGLRRVLRSEGTLVLSTPQARSTLELASKVAFLPGVIELVRRCYREPVLPTGHISLLTARQVAELLGRGGFRVLEHSTWGLYLPLVAELGGQAGLRLERRLERRIAGGRLDGLLWTQCWVAERAR